MIMWLRDVDEKDYNHDKNDGEDKDKYHKDDNDDDGAEATVIAMRGVASPLLLCAPRTWNRIDDGTDDDDDDDNDRTDDDDGRSDDEKSMMMVAITMIMMRPNNMGSNARAKK